jgi:hypothetical protein
VVSDLRGEVLICGVQDDAFNILAHLLPIPSDCGAQVARLQPQVFKIVPGYHFCSRPSFVCHHPPPPSIYSVPRRVCFIDIASLLRMRPMVSGATSKP